MQMRSLLALTTVAIVVCAGTRAAAHHSFAAEYDGTKAVRLVGTLVKIEWTNPHTYFYIDVKEPDGSVTRWGLEAGSPGALSRRGFKRGDIKLGDAHIKKGDWVLFGITAANRDPKVFPNPHKFDPSRDNRELISFGRGVHFCLGMHLARRELETALKVVFERYPNIRLKPGSKVEFVGGVLRGPRELWVEPYGG